MNFCKPGNYPPGNYILKKSLKAFSRQTVQLKQKETVFTLGNRKMVIESELEAPVIVPHAERIQEQSHRSRYKT